MSLPGGQINRVALVSGSCPVLSKPLKSPFQQAGGPLSERGHFCLVYRVAWRQCLETYNPRIVTMAYTARLKTGWKIFPALRVRRWRQVKSFFSAQQQTAKSKHVSFKYGLWLSGVVLRWKRGAARILLHKYFAPLPSPPQKKKKSYALISPNPHTPVAPQTNPCLFSVSVSVLSCFYQCQFQ